MSKAAGTRSILQYTIAQTELLAGTPIELVSPVNGYIETLQGIVQTAVTTGGVISVEINTVAVVGLSLTVADAAAKGVRYSDTPTLPSATRKVLVGDRIEIIPAAEFATAGALAGQLVINSADVTPDAAYG